MEQDSKHSLPALSRIPDAPPRVEPLPADTMRPLWSVMIPVYNCVGFLRETLESVLGQDPGAGVMQIEVVDDASTDGDICALVREVGKGRITYFRQQANVGSLRNFQTCLERSKGHLVHILHGDDRVRTGFYAHMTKLFEDYSPAGAAFCRYAYINEQGDVAYNHDAEMDHEGVLENWLPRICERQRIQYVAMVVRRNVYEALGGFFGVEYGEDWEMWARIAASYRIAYTPEVLAEYRRHYASVSGKAFLSGGNMNSLAWVMDQVQRHLPATDREKVMRRSRSFYAHYALRVANTLWSKFKSRRGASAQAWAAWRMSRDARLLLKIIKLYTRISLNI